MDRAPENITPEPGMRFLHGHQVTDTAAGDRRPETCEVTAVRHGVVYYRDSSGSRSLAPAEAFAACVLEWLRGSAAPGAEPGLPGREDFERRMAALAPYTAGPGYVRGVRECLFDARASLDHAALHEPSAVCALYWLEEAERCAGLITVAGHGSGKETPPLPGEASAPAGVLAFRPMEADERDLEPGP